MAFLHSVDIIQYNSLQQNTLIWDSMNNGPHVLITLALTPRRTLNFPNSHWMGPTRLQTSGSDQSHVFRLRKFWENLSTSLTSTCSNLITDQQTSDMLSSLVVFPSWLTRWHEVMRRRNTISWTTDYERLRCVMICSESCPVKMSRLK